MDMEVLEVEQEVKNEVMDYVKDVKGFKITNVEKFTESAQFMTNLARLRKRITEYFKPLKDAAKKAHTSLTTREKEELFPILEAEGLIKKMRLDWKTEQDRIAEEIRFKLEKKERDRIAKEKEKLLKRAERSKDEATKDELIEKAEHLVEQPIIVPSQVEKTSKVDGGGSITWITDIEVEVVDAGKLLSAVIAGQAPHSIVEFKTGRLKAWVKAMGIKQGQVDGIKIREIQRESTRT